VGVKVNFNQVPDQADFSLPPIGRHPARLEIDAYQKDAQGNFMTGPDGKPVFKRTAAGDTKWDMLWHLLDLPDDRYVSEGLFFSTKGLKRVKIIFVRGGFATGKEDDIDLEPEDLDGTFWWVEVEHPDPVDSLQEGASLKESKYTFKAKCDCATCQKYNGQKVSVYAKVGFAGMNPMRTEEMAKYLKPAQSTSANGNAEAADAICDECTLSKHFHKRGAKGCTCEQESHLDF
jgi:hypothetical protein